MLEKGITSEIGMISNRHMYTATVQMIYIFRDNKTERYARCLQRIAVVVKLKSIVKKIYIFYIFISMYMFIF